MEPTSGGLDHRTEPLERVAPPDSDTEPTARTPHRGEKALLGAIVTGSAVIAGIGFTGSYAAVRSLAVEKGFSWFSYAFPVGVDVGIAVILALDVYLTWRRMAFWPLRMIAWVLTGATVAFNASISWPDPVGTVMHGVIPLLFVIVVEAARHVVRRSAELSEDQRMDSIRWWRWALAPMGTFRLWRRMKLWEIRSYDEIVHLERARVLYRKELRRTYGRKWRSRAPLEVLRPLRLAGYGIKTNLLQSLADSPHWTVDRNDDIATEQQSAHPADAALAVGAAQPSAIAPAAAAPEQPNDPVVPVALPPEVEEALAAVAELRTLVAALTALPAVPQQVLPVPAVPAAAPAGPDSTAGELWWRTDALSGHPAGVPQPASAWQPAVEQILPAEPPRFAPADPEPQVSHAQPAEPEAALPEPLVTGGTPVESTAEQPTDEMVPPQPDPEPEEQEQTAEERALSKKERARIVYVEHQEAGRELTRGRLAELVGYAHEGSARTVYKELQTALGPIQVRPDDQQLPVELAAAGAPT
jgi:hypothetical protein